MMWNGFDILKKLPDGGIVWIEAAKDLQSARERIKLFATYMPGEYVIFCQETQAAIELPWASYPRQELVATEGQATDRHRTAKSKEKKKAPEKSLPKPSTNQIIAEIVADIGRTIAGKK